MTAQTQLFENDLLGGVPALFLLLVLILTALGVVAHATFA
jgi:cell division protein FtsL